MRVLITGAAGMLGQDLQRAAAAGGHDVTAVGRRELDIADGTAVAQAIAGASPEIAFNCAAWTDVDGAEADELQATAVNGEAAGHLARAVSAAGGWLVHISSDYVFDGRKREPYLESDAVCPLSAYGRSKLVGEREVARGAPERHTIVRSSWLFGAGGGCFPATIARLARERDELTVVDDQVGCPTFTGHLAAALVSIASDGPPLGLLHLAGGGECSWFQFAQEIVRSVGADCVVRPCATADMVRPAVRPGYSVLRSERGLVPVLPDWRQGLREYLAAVRVSA